MSCLLDTHTLLWMLSDSKRLSATARTTILGADTELHFSMASYWEIGIKISLGKLSLAEAWQETIPRQMTRNGITWMPISPAHVHEVSCLPWHHRDPFDRLLAAQAKVNGLAIVSADTAFDRYEVERVW